MSTTVRREPTRRLGRADWVHAALEAIAEEGLGAVAVEPLARRLGVTKGSFYAHFSSRAELVEAALASWEHSHGTEGLARFAEIEDPAERLGELLLAATRFSQSGELSVHFSLLGELHDPRVRAAVERVASLRLEFLESTYRELGLPPRRAAHWARLAYATYVGLRQMARECPRRRLTERELGGFMADLRSALIVRQSVG